MARKTYRSIQEYRQVTGKSQAEVAELLGCAQPMVCRWEKGTAIPRPARALQIAKVLNIPVTTLLIGNAVALER